MLPDDCLKLIAKVCVAHCRDPCKAYPAFVSAIDAIVEAELKRAELSWQEDAAAACQKAVHDIVAVKLRAWRLGLIHDN